MQGQKQDYVSGEIAVPKFHCPRCRDHYYGLTPYPCDEELARLMREGLWRTGETTSPDKSIRRGMMRASLSETNIQRKSNSNKDMESSSKIKLPPLNTKNSNMTSSNDAGSTGGHKKRTKKISFALDSDYGSASPSTSEASLTGRDDSSNSKGRKRRIGDDRKKGSLGSNKGSLTGLNDTSDAGSNSSLDRFRMAGHQKKSDNQSSTSKLIESQTNVGGILKDGGHSGGASLSAGSASNKDTANTSNAASAGLDGETSNIKGKGSGGTDTVRSSTDGNSTTMLIDKASMTDITDCSNGGTGLSSRNTTNGSGSTHNDGNASVGSKYGNKSSEATDSGSRKNCNVVNCQNSTNSFNKSNAAVDDGEGSKKKAPPGYMRAASPSQSEWADPTHAKKWINNIAPPHPTFRYNNDNNDDYDDEFSGQVFKPRGWHQQKKPPKSESMDDPLLLPVGPRFTRAFTFSYMPGSGGGTKASGSNSAAGGSKKSSRKKTS